MISRTNESSSSSTSTISQSNNNTNTTLPVKSPLAEKHGHDTNITTAPIDDGLEAGSTNKRRRRRMDKRNGCLRCLCCACCLPKWATYVVWFIIISIIIVVIVLGAIMSKFIMPTIEIGGVTNSTGTTGKSSSPLSFNGDKLQLNFGLTVLAKNPNLLPIYVSDMNATAFYPDPKGTGKMSPVGGGYLAYQELPKYSDFNFTFPFSIVYDPLEDPDQTILNDLAEKCGLTGDEPTDLTIAYTIRVTAKVLFVSVHPTIDSQSTFPCPIQNNTVAL